MKKIQIQIAIVVVVVLVVLTSAYTVNQTKQAIILRFGNVVSVVTNSGLHFKIPVIDKVKYIENRVLNLDPPAQEVILGDSKRLEVDVFARYQITDPVKYYQVLNTEAQAVDRLNKFINSGMRSVLGKVSLDEVLSADRAGMMEDIKNKANSEVSRMGVKIVDVRIGRADLPEQNSKAVFARMSSERQREAAEFRAQGEETALKIKADANKQKSIILSTATKTSEEIKGSGDKQAINIYAKAYGQDPEFFEFYRKMEAYKDSLTTNSTIILSPSESEFLKDLN